MKRIWFILMIGLMIISNSGCHRKKVDEKGVLFIDPRISKDIKINQDTDIVVVPDYIPKYPSNDTAVFKFIKDHLKYPLMAKEVEIEGTSYVRFEVNKDGSVTHVKTSRGLGGGCDEEAIKTVKLMAKMKPGLLNGKIAPGWYVIPIKFELPKKSVKKIDVLQRAT